MIDGWDSVSVGNKEVTRDNAVIFMVTEHFSHLARLIIEVRTANCDQP